MADGRFFFLFKKKEKRVKETQHVKTQDAHLHSLHLKSFRKKNAQPPLQKYTQPTLPMIPCTIQPKHR